MPPVRPSVRKTYFTPFPQLQPTTYKCQECHLVWGKERCTRDKAKTPLSWLWIKPCPTYSLSQDALSRRINLGFMSPTHSIVSLLQKYVIPIDLKPYRVICVSCGFGITKADIFPAVAAQGAGQILLVSSPRFYSKAIDSHGSLIEYYTSLPYV